jgi:hypothetical protein
MNEWILGDARCVRPRRTRGFWRSQFDDAPTSAQRKFDIAFGVVIPALCLVFDPIIFKGGIWSEGGVYQQYQFYAYAVSVFEVVALCAWPLTAGRLAAALAGVMLAGAAFSFLVGLAIVPYSLIGLLFLIGVLGFVPFLTAFVYLRNAWRAAAGLGRAGPPKVAAAALACGFVFALGAPGVVHVSVTKEVAAALADVRAGRELSTRKLQALRAVALVSGDAAYDELVWAYGREGDPARRARLAKVYLDITLGDDIERRLMSLSD